MPGNATIWGIAFPPFTPATLPNLAIWNRFGVEQYEDTAMTTPASEANPLRGWGDQSGTVNHMKQPVADAFPFLASNAGDFISNSSLFSDNALTLKPGTFFCLIRFDDLTGTRRIIDAFTAGCFGIDTNGTDLRLLSSDTALIGTCSAAMTTGAWKRLVVTYTNAGAYAFFVNGSAAGSGVNDVALGTARIAFGGKAGLMTDGQVKEWGVYTDAKSAGEAAQLDSYLAAIP